MVLPLGALFVFLCFLRCVYFSKLCIFLNFVFFLNLVFQDILAL